MLGREVVEGQHRLEVVDTFATALGWPASSSANTLATASASVRGWRSRCRAAAASRGDAAAWAARTAPGRRRAPSSADGPFRATPARARSTAQRAVTHRQHRRSHPAGPEVAQQLGPRLGRLAIAVGDRDQLLGAIRANTHDREQTQRIALTVGIRQPHPRIHPIGPDVDVVDLRQVAGSPLGMLGLPRLTAAGGGGPHRRPGCTRWSAQGGRPTDDTRPGSPSLSRARGCHRVASSMRAGGGSGPPRGRGVAPGP